MRKLLIMLAVFFIFLTFAGGIYVLVSDGTASAGNAVVPMVLGLACLSGYRRYKK